MSAADISTIDRVRRAMPRNPDVMTVCDLAEQGIIAHQTALRESKCPICEGRRVKNAASMQKGRAKKKTAVL